MSLTALLRMTHVLAVVLYLGGGIMLHFSVRRALNAVPPAQAAILSSKIGTHFTGISWAALTLWGVSGYVMLARSGMGDLGSPLTLFVEPALLGTGLGTAMLVMIGGWYVLLVNALIITFVLRPRVAERIEPNEGAERVQQLGTRIGQAARWIDVLAVTNLVVAAAAFVAAKMYF